MKKFAALAAALVLAAFIFGAPYYAGMKIEKALLEHASPAATFELFSIDSISIKRGIFSSDVEWGVSIATVDSAALLDEPEGDDEVAGPPAEGEINLTVKAHISHGPFAFPGEFHGLESSSYGWGVVDTEVFLPEFSDTAPLNVCRAVATFDDMIVGEARSDAGSFKNEERGTLIAWGDLTTSFSANFEGDVLRYSGLWQNFKVEENVGKLLVSGMSFDGAFASNPPEGSFEVKIASVDFSDGSGETSLKGFGWKVDTGSEDGMISSEGVLHIDEVTADGKRSGPMGATLGVKRISLEAYGMLEELGERISELGPDADPDVVQTVMMGEMMRIVPIILDGAPVIELKEVYAKSPFGDLDGGAVLSFVPNGPVNIFDQQDLISKLRGDMAFSLTIPEGGNSPLAQKAEELKEMGLVVVEDGKYVMRASFDGATLTVNGAPLWEAPPALNGGAPGMAPGMAE